ALPDLRVGEHVHAMEALHSAGLQHLAGERREAALRELGRTLHEQDHGMPGDLLLDSLFDVHDSILALSRPASPRLPAHYPFHLPPVTRSMPARSAIVSTAPKPSLARRVLTASPCPSPCSRNSHPPGSRWAGAPAAISRSAARPSAPATSASSGSNRSAARCGSPLATYGGLDRTKSKRSPANGSNHRPSRNSTSRARRRALARATSSAAALASVATTRAAGRWRLMASATAPEPVPRSTTLVKERASASSTS